MGRGGTRVSRASVTPGIEGIRGGRLMSSGFARTIDVTPAINTSEESILDGSIGMEYVEQCVAKSILMFGS
jgi:hypothetical protein